MSMGWRISPAIVDIYRMKRMVMEGEENAIGFAAILNTK
jgi:hypothetical protein